MGNNDIVKVDNAEGIKAATDSHGDAFVEYLMEITFKVTKHVHCVKLTAYTTTSQLVFQPVGEKSGPKEHLGQKGTPRFFVENFLLPWCNRAISETGASVRPRGRLDSLPIMGQGYLKITHSTTAKPVLAKPNLHPPRLPSQTLPPLLQHLSRQPATVTPDRITHTLYKNTVRILPLAFIDDLNAISKCGSQSLSLNSFINTQIELKKLRFGENKC